MERITSFTVDHNKLNPGMYVSRIDGKDNNIVTYDLRIKKPNAGSYMDCAGMHTIEHLAATLYRNSPIANHIIYFGGMFCRTGFYLIVEDVDDSTVIEYTKEVFARIADWFDDIPGKSAVECGNYLDHNIEQARLYAKEYSDILKGCSVDTLKY